MWVNNLPEVALDSAAAGTKPAISRSQVQRPIYCATEPHIKYAVLTRYSNLGFFSFDGRNRKQVYIRCSDVICVIVITRRHVGGLVYANII